jgi:RimJ/RimL family protein N-acetyltransferase
MNLSLRSFTSNDIGTCEQWARDIAAEQFQSRHHPRSFNGKDFYSNKVLWSWYIIIVDGEEVGTVWLEKNTITDEVAILGVMLSQKDKFGKGIGREAILQAIKQARNQLGYLSVELNVRKDNIRAIACYQHCGFIIIREGIKISKDGKEIPYLTMRLDLDEKFSG